MSTLKEILHRSEILRKSLGKQIRLLRKKAKKAARGKAPLRAEDVRQEFQGFQLQLQEVLNLEAARLRAEAEKKVDLIVDGKTLLHQAPLGLLLPLRKELKYQQKLLKALRKVDVAPELDAVQERLRRLRKALDDALHEANQGEVEEEQISEEICSYLFAPLNDADENLPRESR